MLVRAPYTFTLPFVLAVCCWFRHNAAIPLASHLPVTNQDAFREKKTISQNNWDDDTVKSRPMRKELSSVISDSDSDETIQNMINNENMNMNMNIIGRNVRLRNGRHRSGRHHSYDKHHKRGTKKDSISVTPYQTLEDITKEEQPINCASGKKKNQRYSSSFVGNATNPSLSVDKEFNEVVGNNSKVKTTSSIHEDEDITLCWIETTTIKEDKSVLPPKRLVIREYTISFENSATIPDRYLECKRLKGELEANDPEIGRTALFEVIDEDTKVSRVVNFTSVGHVGNIVVWQHKMVKCGVGPVVSKNIVEWNDGSKYPKKRVEIKVSPKMHQLTATKTEEEEPCSEEEQGNTHTDATIKPCENAESCEVTTKTADIPTIHDDQTSTTEEMITEPARSEASGESDSEENLSLPTGITKLPTLSNEEIFGRSTIAPKTPPTISEETNVSDCKKDSSDPACMIQKDATPSSEELPELSDMTSKSTVSMDTKVSTPSDDKEIITETEISNEEGLSVTTESFKSREEEEITSDLVTEETIVFIPTTDISMELSKVHVSQLTDKSVTSSKDVGYDSNATTISRTKITTSRSVTEDKKEEEHSISEEGNGDNSIESISEEFDKIGDISSSNANTIASGEVGDEQEATTAVSSFGFTEFAGESDKSGKILDKLSGPSVSIDSITTEISSTFEEISSEKSEESIISEIEETTTIGLKTTEKEGFISTVLTTSLPSIKSTVSSTTSSEVDYSCENSDDCIYVSSSEACDESGDCGRTTTGSCESGICSEEEDQSSSDTTSSPTTTEIQRTTALANIATTISIPREVENTSTVISNVPTTVDARRSTTTSRPRHKLTLKVKILLEHVNENKEKHNLVEVEKNLSLDENADHHDNSDLLEQLKSLNDSVNMETLSALLNCTSLGKLTNNPSFINQQLNDIYDNHERLESTNPGSEDSISEQFVSEQADAKNEDSQYSKYDQEHEVAFRRRRRRSLDDKIGNSSRLEITTQDLFDIDNSTSSVSVESLSTLEFQDNNMTTENIQFSTTTNNPEEGTSDAVYTENESNVITEINESTISPVKENINETEIEIVRQTLPGIREDVSAGLQHVVQLAQSNLTSLNNAKEMVKIDLLGIIADPQNIRIHSRRRRAAAEEVGHWSNERINKAPMGGSLRSFTEFTLYKVPS